MHNKLFLSSKSGEQYHIHIITVKGTLAHLLCLHQVANCREELIKITNSTTEGHTVYAFVSPV